MDTSVKAQIKNKIKSGQRGKIYFPSDFSQSGNVESVKKALFRLEEEGFLVRLSHGIYLYPKTDKILGVRYPSIDEIAKVIAKRDRARIIPTGVQALNKLGLSTQIPMQVVYLTDGSPRSIKVGRRSLKFKKTTPKNLSLKGEISSLVIQALREIGKDRLANEQRLKVKEWLLKEEKEMIKHDANLAPAWMRGILLEPVNK